MVKRVMTAPAPLLHGVALPPNRVTSVRVNPDEEVRWTWTHTSSGSYVSGYTIIEVRPPKKSRKAKGRARTKR